MKRILILYSGGADSRLMLQFALNMGYHPECLLINYNQRNSDELKVAEIQLEELNIPYQTIPLTFMSQIDSGLTGDGKKNTTGEVHEMHVPGRNTIFLSVAYSIAETSDIDTIWIGCDWSDRLNLFPDCYQEYILAINNVFEIAGPIPITVEAPLMGLSKDNIIKLIGSFGISSDEYFSGYGEL